MASRFRVARRIAIAIGVAVGAIALCVFLIGWLLTRPVQRIIGPAPPELNAQEITLRASDGVLVHGWWCPVSNRRRAVLLLPGVRANRLDMVDRAKFLRRAGYSVLLIDLRATGETIGKRISFGWDERRDVLAAVEFLRGELPDGRIAIVGSSLGGAAALFATPPLHVDALVLEAVYPDIARATHNRIRKYAGRVVDSFVTPVLLAALKPLLGAKASDLAPVGRISETNCPILIIGGVEDVNTTVDDTRGLFAAAKDPKRLWLIPGAGHFDFHHFAGREYESNVLGFLGDSFAAK